MAWHVGGCANSYRGVRMIRQVLTLGASIGAALVLVTPFLGGGGPGLAPVPAAAPALVAASSTTALAVPAAADAPAVERDAATVTRVAVADTAQALLAEAPAAVSTAPEPEAPPAFEELPAMAASPIPASEQTAISSSGPTPMILDGGAGGGLSLDQFSPGCGAYPAGQPGTAPSKLSGQGVLGTTSNDVATFANMYNSIRLANCLAPVPYQNIRYDSCMELRLFWMAESPSTNPLDAWGHMGSTRIDGVPSPAGACDGNLAGGYGNTGATVAQKWWDSIDHRNSLYRPGYTGSMNNVCILISMTHGGIPNEPVEYTRAAARWVTC